MLSKITVSPAPHVSKAHSTQSIMLDVIIGLMPAVIAAGVFFHLYAVKVILGCVVGCVLSEWVFNKIRKKDNSVWDLSAVVTGIILALSLPPMIPVWAAVLGGAFAIVICKMMFGGLGANVFNPAMAARAFLAASFGMLMTTWTVPSTEGEYAFKTMRDENVTIKTQATPLAWSKQAVKAHKKSEGIDGNTQPTPSESGKESEKTNAKTIEAETLKAAFWGNTGGCLGETSAFALIIGGVYLLVRKTISWHIPAAVLLAAIVCAAVGYFVKPEAYVSPVYHLLTGGMLICAFFIATDPVTKPLSEKGMLIFGAGVGVLIMLIRMLGEYPEGVMYAVLIMNAVSPLIDKFCKLIPAGGKPNVK